MTLEDFVLKTLANRIRWLHGPSGPEGKLSHDKFAKRLIALGAPATISRQTVINWESGTEPRDSAQSLSKFSGFPVEAFAREGAEVLVEELSAPRLQRLQVEADTTLVILVAVLGALAEHDIRVPLSAEAAELLATAAPANQAGMH